MKAKGFAKRDVCVIKIKLAFHLSGLRKKVAFFMHFTYYVYNYFVMAFFALH
jgi:hypothetical protein